MTGISESLSDSLPYVEFKFNLPYSEFLGVFSSSILSVMLFSSAWFYSWYYVLFSYQVASVHERLKQLLFASLFYGLCSVLPEFAWILNPLQVQIQYLPYGITMTCRRQLPDYIPTLPISVLLKLLEKLNSCSCSP